MPRKKDSEIYEYKLKSGKTRYGFKTYLGTSRETGKPIKVTRQGFTTHKEAIAAKTKLKANGATHEEKIRDAQKHTKTIDEVWKSMGHSQELSLRPSSLYRKNSAYKNTLMQSI